MTINTNVIDRSPLPWDTYVCSVCGYRLTPTERRALKAAVCAHCGIGMIGEYECIRGDGKDDV